MDKFSKFLRKAILKHGKKFDYSLVEYVNSTTKIKIICPVHGIIEQSPSSHLHKLCGCRDCGFEYRYKSRTKNTDEFIQQANIIHDFKFDYSKVEYVHGKRHVIIICKNGHEFKQTPNSHLKGFGCPNCYYARMGDRNRLKLSEFIYRSNLIHDCKYDYTSSVYKSNKQKIEIICPIHGLFKQRPSNHMQGAGCPKCKTYRNELKLYNKLVKHFPHIEINHQFSPEWLDRQVFDIYIPKFNIAIEYNGIQHYQPIEQFGGIDAFKKQQERDNKKRIRCEANSCILFEIPYTFKELDIQLFLNSLIRIINDYS